MIIRRFATERSNPLVVAHPRAHESRCASVPIGQAATTIVSLLALLLFRSRDQRTRDTETLKFKASPPVDFVALGLFRVSGPRPLPSAPV
jgi:hypothetical protein